MTNQSNLTLASREKSQQGMTLIEVMIAIVLLAFVMFGVTSITENSQNAKDRTIQTDKDNMQIETVFARMDWDFSQIWSPLYFSQRYQGNLNPQANPGIEEMLYLYERHPRFRMPSKEGLPIPIFRSPEKSEFIFLTLGNRRKVENQKQSNFMWVRYYLGDTPKSPGDEDAGGSIAEGKTNKSLLRQVFPEDVWAKEEFDFDNTRSSSMLDNVESLEFQFWNPIAKKWETNIKTVPDGENIQRGLKIIVKWFDGRGNKRSIERWLRPSWTLYMPKDQPTNPGATTTSDGGGGTSEDGTSEDGTDTNGDGVINDEDEDL